MTAPAPAPLPPSSPQDWIPRKDAHITYPNVFGRTRHRLDWTLRTERDELLAAGVLIRVGSDDLIHVARYLDWKVQQARSSVRASRRGR